MRVLIAVLSQGLTEIQTQDAIIKEIKDIPGGDHWTALVFNRKLFEVEKSDDINNTGMKFAQAACIAKVHDYIWSTMEGMAETAARTLLECKFAYAEGLARRITECECTEDARDLWYSRQWTNKVYKNCIITSAKMCRAKFVAGNATAALGLIREASDLLDAGV
jgi:hypothetical protein